MAVKVQAGDIIHTVLFAARQTRLLGGLKDEESDRWVLRLEWWVAIREYGGAVPNGATLDRDDNLAHLSKSKPVEKVRNVGHVRGSHCLCESDHF